jgi:putative flippase GtrA
LGYSLASILALGLDFVAFIALIGSGLAAPLAGAAGYAMGLTLHYSLSTRFVFAAVRTEKPEVRLYGEFALTGLAGLAITAAVIAAATGLLGLNALMAKVLAAGTSFLAVFALRRWVVFHPGLRSPAG